MLGSNEPIYAVQSIFITSGADYRISSIMAIAKQRFNIKCSTGLNCQLSAATF